MLLTNATLTDGVVVDVAIVDGSIIAVEPTSARQQTNQLVAQQPEQAPIHEVDLTGHLLLPAFVEPHAHLDKALTVDSVTNETGDLGGAIEAWRAYRPSILAADYVNRAGRAANMLLQSGATAIRTHVDIGLDIGTVAVDALLEVKAALADRLDLQLVGLVVGLTGPDGPAMIELLREALDHGLDAVGGVPHIESDPPRAIDLLLDIAGEYGCPIDLHADETLDPSSVDVETLAARVLALGFEPLSTASHAVALGAKPSGEQQRISELVAAAGISVVTLPQTNLYLQARGLTVAPPRGLTALAALDAAGVTVAAGGDNLRDPFCPLGRADPLEAAALLVMAGHRTIDRSVSAISADGRAVLGLTPIEVEVGSVADLVAIKSDSLTDLVAASPPDRIVIRAGSIVWDGRSRGEPAGRGDRSMRQSPAPTLYPFKRGRSGEQQREW